MCESPVYGSFHCPPPPASLLSREIAGIGIPGSIIRAHGLDHHVNSLPAILPASLLSRLYPVCWSSQPCPVQLPLTSHHPHVHPPCYSPGQPPNCIPPVLPASRAPSLHSGFVMSPSLHWGCPLSQAHPSCPRWPGHSLPQGAFPDLPGTSDPCTWPRPAVLALLQPPGRAPQCHHRAGPPIRSPRASLACHLAGSCSPQWREQCHLRAHTVGCALGDTTNFNNSLRKRQICPFFPPWGKEMYVCAHMCLCTRDPEHHTPEGRGSGTTQPTLAVAHVRTLGTQGSPRMCSDTPTPGSARAGLPWCPAVSRWFLTRRGRQPSREERRRAWPLASQAPSSQLATPRDLSHRPRQPRRRPEKAGSPLGTPLVPPPACVPSLHTQLAPQPRPADGHTKEGTRPSLLCLDPPWSLGSSRGYEAFGNSPPPHPSPFQSRIRPLEILHTNKIVTNLHPRWGVSGSRCHGDHLQGPGRLRLLVQPRDQEILTPALQLGPVL